MLKFLKNWFAWTLLVMVIVNLISTGIAVHEGNLPSLVGTIQGSDYTLELVVAVVVRLLAPAFCLYSWYELKD